MTSAASSVTPPQKPAGRAAWCRPARSGSPGWRRPWPGHGHDPLDQRQAGLEHLGDRRDRADVLHDHADVTGSFPDGTSRPVTALISIFSAPCGYFTVSGRTRDVEVRRAACAPAPRSRRACCARRRSRTRVTPSARIMIRMPKCTRSGYSTMVRWSDVRYGSHSAPLMMSVLDRRRPAAARASRGSGNAAPPSPTTPACLHGLHDLARWSSPSQRGHEPRARHLRRVRGRPRCAPPSPSCRRDAATSRCRSPCRGARRGSATDMKPSASADGIAALDVVARPCTHGLAGLPACCRSGRTTSSGYGMRRIAELAGQLLVLRRMNAVPEAEALRDVSSRVGSVEGFARFIHFVEILLLGIERRARMDDADRAASPPR